MPEQGPRLVNPQLAGAAAAMCVCVRGEGEEVWEASAGSSSKLHISEQTFAHRAGPRGSSFTFTCDSPDSHNNRAFGSAATGDLSPIYQTGTTAELNLNLEGWGQLPVSECECVSGVNGGPCRPGLWGWGPVCSHFLTLSVSQPPILKNTLTHPGRRKRLLNDTGWKGVREPLYIYGLCRSGGSGAVKWSHAPKNSLNSKYMTDSGVRGDGKRNKKKKHTRRETDRRGQCEHCKEYCSQVTAR